MRRHDKRWEKRRYLFGRLLFYGEIRVFIGMEGERCIRAGSVLRFQQHLLHNRSCVTRMVLQKNKRWRKTILNCRSFPLATPIQQGRFWMLKLQKHFSDFFLFFSVQLWWTTVLHHVLSWFFFLLFLTILIVSLYAFSEYGLAWKLYRCWEREKNDQRN